MKILNKHLDLLEKTLALTLYAWMFFRLWPQEWSSSQSASAILLLSEGLVVLFLIIRNPSKSISYNLYDWIIAAGGTMTALLVANGGEPIFATGGTFLMLYGLIVHLGAKISLFRSFGLVAANRGVKTNGLYRLVRHPMYAGYMLTHIGFLLIHPSLWNFGVYIITWSFLIARIMAEEKLLSKDVQYKEYMAKVPWRLIPFVF